MAGMFLLPCVATLMWLFQGGIATMTADIHQLSRQMMLQQLYVEERIRSDGDSGIKRVRHTDQGTRPYHSPSLGGNSLGTIHDHANYINTIGLGEFVAVLNGVEFRTRHNDYKVVKPHSTSSEYHATEPIEFPPVPPSVENLVTVPEQVEEMRQYFRAFKEQDVTIRNYQPYFRPVLCYLEGAWTTNTGSLEESFESDRHHIDANSWLELQEKIRFTSYSGRKSNLENFAYLPTTIMEVTNGTAILAQWNYRMVCHPLKDHLPLNRFRVVDDLASRMSHKRSFKDHVASRNARFQLNPFDEDIWAEGKERHGFLDKLMEQIPGKDNYPAALHDDALGLTAYHLKGTSEGENEILNAGYYHRWYKVMKRGAMGISTRHRGYSDSNIFMALTNNPEVASMSIRSCKRNGHRCQTATQRWTYAIPYEILYLTPLSKWNPYNLEYKGEASSPLGKTVRAGGRNGGKMPEKAFNGTNSAMFCQTPAQFFTGVMSTEAADTIKRSLFVLDRAGVSRKVKASGFRIFQDIGGIGNIRTRYPIVPVHGEGSGVWKELEALKDIVLEPRKYSHMYREPIEFTESTEERDTEQPLILELTERPTSDHTHIVELSGTEVKELLEGEPIYTTSEENEGHSHNMKIVYHINREGHGSFVMQNCDGRRFCEHPRKLLVINPTSNSYESVPVL